MILTFKLVTKLLFSYLITQFLLNSSLENVFFYYVIELTSSVQNLSFFHKYGAFDLASAM